MQINEATAASANGMARRMTARHAKNRLSADSSCRTVAGMPQASARAPAGAGLCATLPRTLSSAGRARSRSSCISSSPAASACSANAAATRRCRNLQPRRCFHPAGCGVLDMPSLLTARLLDESRILMWPAPSFRDQVRTNGRLAHGAMLQLCGNWRLLIGQLKDLKLLSATERLATLLLSLAPRRSGCRRARLPGNRPLVRRLLGVAPQSLSRAFASLRPMGVSGGGRRSHHRRHQAACASSPPPAPERRRNRRRTHSSRNQASVPSAHPEGR